MSFKDTNGRGGVFLRGLQMFNLVANLDVSEFHF